MTQITRYAYSCSDVSTIATSTYLVHDFLAEEAKKSTNFRSMLVDVLDIQLEGIKAQMSVIVLINFVCMLAAIVVHPVYFILVLATFTFMLFCLAKVKELSMVNEYFRSTSNKVR